jgi:hypothetical protein
MIIPATLFLMPKLLSSLWMENPWVENPLLDGATLKRSFQPI